MLPLLVQLWRAITVLPLLLLLNALQPLHPSRGRHYCNSHCAGSCCKQPSAATAAIIVRLAPQPSQVSLLLLPSRCGVLLQPARCCATTTATVLLLLLPSLCNSLLQQRLQAAKRGIARAKAFKLCHSRRVAGRLCHLARNCNGHPAAITMQRPVTIITVLLLLCSHCSALLLPSLCCRCCCQHCAAACWEPCRASTMLLLLPALLQQRLQAAECGTLWQPGLKPSNLARCC